MQKMKRCEAKREDEKRIRSWRWVCTGLPCLHGLGQLLCNEHVIRSRGSGTRKAPCGGCPSTTSLVVALPPHHPLSPQLSFHHGLCSLFDAIGLWPVADGRRPVAPGLPSLLVDGSAVHQRAAELPHR